VCAAVAVGIAVYVPQRERVAVPFYLASLAVTIACIVLGTVATFPRDELLRAGSIITVRRLRRFVDAERGRREQARKAALTPERERIARDLHDSVGAQLTGIGLLAERRHDVMGAKDGPWDEVQDLARVGMQELRDTIWALAAEQHDNATLLASLRQRVESLANAAGCQLEWTGVGIQAAPGFSPAVSFAILSIVREAVTNALRHGRAKHISVRISCTETAVDIAVDDDGIGLAAEPSAGRGLGNMNRRAELMGGFSRIEARQQGGVRVVAKLPLAP
jgi:two-component system, NarL family, sensor histidine kinase UhpB